MKISINFFSEYIRGQLKYYQHRIRSEIGILLEIILNDVKYLIVSPSIKIFALAIAPLSFIYNYHSLWICYTARYVHFTVPLERRSAFVFLSGQVYTSGSTPSKRLNSLSDIILVCLVR